MYGERINAVGGGSIVASNYGFVVASSTGTPGSAVAVWCSRQREVVCVAVNQNPVVAVNRTKGNGPCGT